MNWARDFTSWSTPQKSLPLALPSGLLNPVPMGSMKTRSVLSRRQEALSASLYGGGGVASASTVTTRLGPNAPMCSHTEDEPGPPLYTKDRGRWLASFTSLLV